MRIGIGMEGAAVKQWQFFLKARGFYQGPADGRYDSITQKCTMDFQKQNGLKATGELDFLTYCRAKILGLPPLLNIIDEVK